jgi:hypothetical protein
MRRAVISFVLICSLGIGCSAQTTASAYTLLVKFDNRNPGRKKVPKNDSLRITFLYGYTNDVVAFKMNTKEFISDTLNADNLYGIGGSMLIPKNVLAERTDIYFNGVFIGSLRIKKKYSLAHLEYNKEKKIFTLRYHKYRFVFI